MENEPFQTNRWEKEKKRNIAEPGVETGRKKAYYPLK